jgi:cytochrome c oxidase subunit 2
MTWGPSSALAPAGAQAARLAHLYWIFYGVCAVVYGVTLGLLFAALWRSLRHGRADVDAPRAAVDAYAHGGRLRVVAVGGAITTVVLVALLAVSVRAGRGLNPLDGLGRAGRAITVRVIAHQWWWQFDYPGFRPGDFFSTANEMHIPVGVPVLLELVSRDVIHSFWVPALHGKRDLIPGHDSTTYIEAERVGTFRGQCAEFCGAQHAKMGFFVIAEPPAAFDEWTRHQRQAPPAPRTEVTERGQRTFLGGPCPMCHTIAGTPAGATMGPDLSHLRSRSTLAAGSVPNVRGHLAGWIVDSQNIKPGNRMPPMALQGGELQDLLAYLETLR